MHFVHTVTSVSDARENSAKNKFARRWKGMTIDGDALIGPGVPAYEERWCPSWLPLTFWMPCTWRYEITIDGGSLAFG